jgi:predicted flavoprotein YhiN
MVRYSMAGKRIVVIGAGASGMMAAGRAAEMGARVLLLEKMVRPGKKILISGKTRCNLTNAKALDDFIAMYGSNGRFLYSAFSRFFKDDLLAFLKRYGVKTSTEGDGRIFPASNDASDVVRTLELYMAEHGVELCTATRAIGIQVDLGRVISVESEQGIFPATAVILATGGASFPGTGSTGDGYRMAEALGHTIIKLRPSLAPLVVYESQLARSMQGISLRNVRLTAYQCQAEEIPQSLIPTSDSGRGTVQKHPRHPVIASRRGDVMMTHFGIGGPITLQMSLEIVDALDKGPVSVAIDLKPDFNEKQLNQLLQQDFARYGRRSCRSILRELLPQKMVEPFFEIAGIPPDKLVSQISVAERKRLADLLKSFRFTIKKPLSLSAAMVTAGGVSLQEIDPRTMASRLVKGLYFCGEVIDIDADTGGYNLTAAFATGYAAGESAAAFCAGKMRG